MKIQTRYHGEVDIADKDIWRFDKGLPGFPDEKEFVILAFPENHVYGILQSVNTPSLGFVIVNPFHFFPDYSFDLDDASIAQLELEDEKDVLVYAILTIQDPFDKTTANLQAPIVMNRRNRRAKQVILHDGPYTTKHLLLRQPVAKG